MSHHVRPMNVHVAQGSEAERIVLARAGLPGGQPAEPEVLVPGMPSTPKHDLHYHQGKTIQNLTFTNFYVGGINSWNHDDIHFIDLALAAAMSDQCLNNVMMQYFSNQPITSTFKPSQILPGPAPSLVSQGDVENLLHQLYSDGQLNNFDFGSTIFNFMLPSGTVLTDDPTPGQEKEHHESMHRNPVPHDDEEASSLHGLGGYHGSIHVTETDGTQQTIYYAVGVYSEKRSDGTTNGIPIFDSPWKNVVATFYHELNEARTDCDVEDAIKAGNDPSATKFLGWTSRQGEECGDFPVFEAKPLTEVFQEVSLTDQTGTVPVQFQYSNAVHGPEGPIPNPH
ncbi:MAG TPA: hypothetical protein VE843_11025 [Ktedonobacteraceae bacterium]|nr:hypothetical protein [Ktedonobacteraceae bacterium]